MTEDDRPTLSPRGQTEAEARRRRQAEALRANLARRKAQGRARAEEGESPAKTGECRQTDPQS